MRFGVIGAGKIGQLRIQSIKEDPTAKLVAILDIDTDRAKTAVAGTSAETFSDLDRFLQTEMDAVIVSTPPHLHQNACVAALARGCHVLCEKPMSNTVQGAQAMVDAAIAADRILAVGFNLRYYPFVQFARDAVDQGKIGRIEHVRIFGGHDGLHNFSADWQYKMPESGGGAMMDIGIHMTDLARYFLGEITTVYGVMSETVWNVKGSEDNAIAIFKSPDGIPATYQATWSEWKGYKSYVEVYGDKGMVRGAYAPMQNLLISQEAPNGRKEKVRKFYPEIIVREKLRSWTSTALISFQEELRDFQKTISGESGLPLADGFAGLRSLEIAKAVRDCTASGQPVELKNLGNMRSQPEFVKQPLKSNFRNSTDRSEAICELRALARE